ncbi:MAG TPA: ribonuclease P protein component [Opitutaceae bacterium]|nr:ribonuclease P protein component [Opitutaceae bacterium]
MRFRPEQHLRRPADFRAVRADGRRVECGAFTLWWFRRPASPQVSSPRVGVVASIASVGAATQRNRAKRRLREVFRRHQELVPADCDLLLVARAAVTRVDYAEVEQKFVTACRRIPSPTPPSHA